MIDFRKVTTIRTAHEQPANELQKGDSYKKHKVEEDPEDVRMMFTINSDVSYYLIAENRTAGNYWRLGFLDLMAALTAEREGKELVLARSDDSKPTDSRLKASLSAPQLSVPNDKPDEILVENEDADPEVRAVRESFMLLRPNNKSFHLEQSNLLFFSTTVGGPASVEKPQVLPFFLRSGEYRSLLVRPGDTVKDVVTVLARKTDKSLANFSHQFTLRLRIGVDTSFQKATELELALTDVLLDVLMQHRQRHANLSLAFIFDLRTDRGRRKETGISMKIRPLAEAKSLGFGDIRGGGHGELSLPGERSSERFGFATYSAAGNAAQSPPVQTRARSLTTDGKVSHPADIAPGSRPLTPATPLKTFMEEDEDGDLPPIPTAPLPAAALPAPNLDGYEVEPGRPSTAPSPSPSPSPAPTSATPASPVIYSKKPSAKDAKPPPPPEDSEWEEMREEGKRVWKNRNTGRVVMQDPRRMTITPNMENIQLKDEMATLVGHVKKLREIVQTPKPDSNAFIDQFRVLFQHVKLLQSRLTDEDKTQQVVALSKPVLELAIATKNNLSAETGDKLIGELIVYLKLLAEILR